MSQACIETFALSKKFGDKCALDNLSLTIPAQGIHAIVGSNGAGKSTLFRLLLGLDAPTTGSCQIFGEDSRQLSAKIRGLVGYVNEEHTLPVWMKVKDVVQLQKRFYPQWEDNIYQRTVSSFDIDQNQKVSGLSRGERAGLSLSIALAQQPKLLILDEPTLGLDVVAKQSFLESLMYIGTEQQAAIIYCSHQMDEIERVADNLILMEQGKLINNSAPEDFVERISAWALDFNGSPVELTRIPGFLSGRTIDFKQHVMVADQGDDFVHHLKSLGAVEMHPMPVTLELAVNAFLSRNHSKYME